MRNSLTCAAALCLAATTACADPFGAANWSGPYAGIGHGAIVSGEVTTYNLNSGTLLDTYALPESGYLSVFTGFNVQVGDVVFGVEADYLRLGNTTWDTGFYGDDTVGDIFEVRGRLGYSFDDWLIYGFAGPSWSGVTQWGYTTPMTGYVVGGGLAHGIGGNGFIAFEMACRNYFDPPGGNGEVGLGAHMVTAEIRIGWVF